ncbi:MAG: hypothetical protein ACPIOQ_56990, partial [Promethearchaeia archaeon]
CVCVCVCVCVRVPALCACVSAMALQSLSQAGGDGERDVRAAGDDPPDDGRRNQEARQMRSAGAVVLAGPARAASDSGACYPRGLHFKTAYPAAFVFSLRVLFLRKTFHRARDHCRGRQSVLSQRAKNCSGAR